MDRISSLTRNTNETKISITLNLDGRGNSHIHTGIGFFDHMLGSFARHGFFDLDLMVEGDLEVDTHHTIEDTGIVLGSAIKQALGEKQSIKRYGSMILPMDETLILAAIDLSGRPFFVWDPVFHAERVGTFETEMAKEFFYAVSYAGEMNLHIRRMAGENDHHLLEGIFKAFGKALDLAVQVDDRIQGVLSTKGSL